MVNELEVTWKWDFSKEDVAADQNGKKQGGDPQEHARLKRSGEVGYLSQCFQLGDGEQAAESVRSD